MTIKEVSEKFNISQDTLRYYERVGVIPIVHRNKNGIRAYTEEDIAWVKNAICMRNAGLSIDVLVEYLRLFQQGDDTIHERYELLSAQKEMLLEKKKKLEETIDKLDYKINIYKTAEETGKLIW